MLDAVPCSFSDCYSNVIAKSTKVGINTDGILILFDGTYWKQKSNSSYYLKNHSISGNTYTTNSKFAIKPTLAENWASGANAWYDGGHPATTMQNAHNICDGIGSGWHLTLLSETTVTVASGVPEYNSYWNWFDTFSYTGEYTYVVYKGTQKGSSVATSSAYVYRCTY